MSWRALARRYPVLAIRDFRLLLLDRLLAPFSVGFSVVGVSFAVLKVTGSTADLSYVIAAQTAPMLVFSLVSGVFADRFRPQRVIMAGNLAVVAGEGVFGLLMLVTGHPPLWAMISLEAVNGIGGAVFYPASQALLPRLVPDALLQEGSSISRLAMNMGQMTGAAAAGVIVAVTGPGWALTLCAIGMSGTIPLMLAIKGDRVLRPGLAAAAEAGTSMISELREGWAEFRKHTWLWATVIQYCLVMMAWNGGFMVLGPVVARTHLGGAAAWGAISAADALGLILGGLISLRYTPRRPMLLVVGTGAALAACPLILALVAPLPVICVAALALGALSEVMMVQWTVQMATRIPSGKLARVSSYDAFGSLAAMPLGALIAGPLAARVGVRQTQLAAAAVMFLASAFTLIPRDIWTIRGDDTVLANTGLANTGLANTGLDGASLDAGLDTGLDVGLDVGLEGDELAGRNLTGTVPGVAPGAIASARVGADRG
jgi:predicted MFS family arabinose efflux permease